MPDLTLPQRGTSLLRSGFLPVLPSFTGLRIYREQTLVSKLPGYPLGLIGREAPSG
jgi:hypothetical protein